MKKLIDKSMLETIVMSLLYKEYDNFNSNLGHDINIDLETIRKDCLVKIYVMLNCRGSAPRCIRTIIVNCGSEKDGYYTIMDHTPFGDIYLDIYPDRTEIRNEMEITDPAILEDFSDKLIRKIACYVKTCMPSNKDYTDEGLISRNALGTVFCHYVTSELKKRGDQFSHTKGGAYNVCNRFEIWTLIKPETHSYNRFKLNCIGMDFIDSHWEIYNYKWDNKHVNIRVYPNRVEFIEDSEFDEFDREFMYGLYIKIKEIVSGNSEDNNKEKDDD